jgi:hypothetical protein
VSGSPNAVSTASLQKVPLPSIPASAETHAWSFQFVLDWAAHRVTIDDLAATGRGAAHTGVAEATVESSDGQVANVQLHASAASHAQSQPNYDSPENCLVTGACVCRAECRSRFVHLRVVLTE